MDDRERPSCPRCGKDLTGITSHEHRMPGEPTAMSLEHCEEYVGAASPTQYRKTCGRPATHLAAKVAAGAGGSPVGTTFALCARHAKDYDGQPLWRVVALARTA